MCEGEQEPKQDDIQEWQAAVQNISGGRCRKGLGGCGWGAAGTKHGDGLRGAAAKRRRETGKGQVSTVSKTRGRGLLAGEEDIVSLRTWRNDLNFIDAAARAMQGSEEERRLLEKLQRRGVGGDLHRTGGPLQRLGQGREQEAVWETPEMEGEDEGPGRALRSSEAPQTKRVARRRRGRPAAADDDRRQPHYRDVEDLLAERLEEGQAEAGIDPRAGSGGLLFAATRTWRPSEAEALAAVEGQSRRGGRMEGRRGRPVADRGMEELATVVCGVVQARGHAEEFRAGTTSAFAHGRRTRRGQGRYAIDPSPPAWWRDLVTARPRQEEARRWVEEQSSAMTGGRPGRSTLTSTL